ncbi:MAG: septation protein A [Proteobacteria bacterium]|nr:septation protein A [Pseudomonadota bacterium]
MQLLADFFPLILFFAAFKLGGIMVATGVAIVASVVQIAWFHHQRKLSAVHWLSFAIIVVFGGATLLLQDENFIKWKPTVLYATFAVILAGGKLAGRDLLAHVMKGLELPPAVWTRLTWAWTAFFAAMAVANWYVAFHYPTSTWVNFKVWGALGLCLLFALGQGLFLARYMGAEQTTTES